MELRKTLLNLVVTGAILLASVAPAMAWNSSTDVFDWGQANSATKEQIVKDLQEILIKKKILNKRYTASSLVKMVEKGLAIDNEQAIIIYKMCEGLNLDCDGKDLSD